MPSLPPAPKRFRDTGTFWLTALSLALVVARRPRAAGLALLGAGVGYSAVVLERHTGDDLRRVREVRWSDLDPWQWTYHAAIAAIGYRLLTGADRA